MHFFRVIVFFAFCLVISGILAFIPIVSIEKLRSGYVKIDLIPAQGGAAQTRLNWRHERKVYAGVTGTKSQYC